MYYWDIADGAYIIIIFTQYLTGSISNNESHFTVSWQEYNKVPGGVLISKSFPPLSTFQGTDSTQVVLEMDWNHRFYNVAGQITVDYDGAGTLQGEGGSVEAFHVSFIPTDLIEKPNPNDEVNLNISNVAVSKNLIRIYYTDVKEDEHLSIASVSWTGTLIHIDDI